MLLSLCLDLRRPWRDVRTLAEAADAARLHTAYVADHFMPYGDVDAPPPAGAVLEGWTTLTAIAASTHNIRIGTLVLGATYRHPAVVANMAVTLDQISGGRLTLGLGAGWQQNEHRAYGIRLPDVAERLERFEESTQVIRALLGTNRATFDGRHYTLLDARCEPRPVQDPLPILVAGAGEKRTIPIAARHADAWHAWVDPDGFRHKSAVLDAACTEIGRDPSAVRRLTGQVAAVTPSSPSHGSGDDVVGSAAYVAEGLGAYRDAGVDEFIVRDHADTPLRVAITSVEVLASDVVPELR